MSECKSFPIFFSALLFRHLQNQSFFSNKTGRRGSLPKSDFGKRIRDACIYPYKINVAQYYP